METISKEKVRKMFEELLNGGRTHILELAPNWRSFDGFEDRRSLTLRIISWDGQEEEIEEYIVK